jgi:hypothetical protein
MVWPTSEGESDLPEAIPRCLDALRRHYVAERSFYLRIAPAWRTGYTLTASPDDSGLVTSDILGWASAVIDLTRSEETLRAGLLGNWRNGLSKAERLGVEVERGENETFFKDFIEEYSAFLSQRRFVSSLTPDLIKALRASSCHADAMIIYRARHDGRALGSALIVRYGECSEYLAGTLLEAGRPLNPGQLLLWRAMCGAKAVGSTRFDVGGMDPVRTAKGIYDFKKGMGGTPYRLGNEIHSIGGGIRCGIAARIVSMQQKRLAVSG